MLNNVLLYFNTLKYLKLKQIWWRFVYLFPKLISLRKSYPQTLVIEFKDLLSKDITSDYDTFHFLNEYHQLSKIGWDCDSISKLWRYNLHYFDFLNQNIDRKEELEFQNQLIETWIKDNPFGKGTGWEPYPTSLRVINWVKWHWKTQSLSSEAKLSLWNQINWLAKRPEFHLLGNHLFVNAKALLFGCSIFSLDEKSYIYIKAIKILKEELTEQFLQDGAHFELSPMYHALAMKDFLDLYQLRNSLSTSFPSEQIGELFSNGMKWLSLLKYENDELAHFNDCANGVAPTYKELYDLGLKIGLKLRKDSYPGFQYLMDSGFAVVKSSKCHLIMDIGHIGPDYLPGHAHADTLSFELALNGKRIIVNSGTGEYGVSSERLKQRSTSAHSTIEVDGVSSSEVWSGFRVARRAKVSNIHYSISDEAVYVSASHDGYQRLNKNPIHTRSWNLTHGRLDIIDHVTGKGNEIKLRFHLHPSLVIKKSVNELILYSEIGPIAEVVSDLSMDVVKSSYHDKFGSQQVNSCIMIKGEAPFSSHVSIKWAT